MHHLLIPVLDLGGTFVFAISGAATAVRRRMDIFGVLVLAFAAGNVGGITRDLRWPALLLCGFAPCTHRRPCRVMVLLSDAATRW